MKRYIAVMVEWNEHFQRADACVLGIYSDVQDVPDGDLYVVLQGDCTDDHYVKFHFRTSTAQTPHRAELLHLTEDELYEQYGDNDEDIYPLNEMMIDWADQMTDQI